MIKHRLRKFAVPLLKQVVTRQKVFVSKMEPKGQAAPVAQHRDAPLRVIIFIGHHKVGSTSLQDYLSRNAVALSGAGILYPYVDFEGLAHFAARAAGHNPSPNALPINVREPHNALAFKMLATQHNGVVPGYHKGLPALPQMFHAIKQQIRYSQPHTVILAAEVFANFNGVSPRLIEQLTQQFPGAEFTLVATLRRIDEYLASWQGQRLKFGHQIEPLRGTGLDSYLKGIHFNYRRMVEGWLQVLPQATVILRDYAQVRAAGGSVADFITQTQLELPEGLAPERRENDSFHRSIYEIIRRANAALPQSNAAQLRRDLRDMTPNLELPPSHSIELFGADNRARMLDHFRPIDAWLGDVMGRQAFFEDLEVVSEQAGVPELEAARAALDLIGAREGWCKDEMAMQFMSSLADEL